MKKLAFVAAFLAASLAAYAQGTVNFNNRVVGVVDAPIFGVDNVTKLAGTGFSAQLYSGPAGAAEAALTAVGPVQAFRTGAAAGYIVAPANEVNIPGVGAGGTATLQVRAWAGAFASYEAAVAGGSPAGKSTTFQSAPLGGSVGGAPPNPGAALVGLTSFSLVPEPSTIMLGALGLGALLLRRKK
jgi:hypothetical protein